MVWLYARFAAFLEEGLQPLVLECLNHALLYSVAFHCSIFPCQSNRAGMVAAGIKQARHFAKAEHVGMQLASALVPCIAAANKPKARANPCAAGAASFASVFRFALGRDGTP
jgi:hypothetical protein